MSQWQPPDPAERQDPPAPPPAFPPPEFAPPESAPPESPSSESSEEVPPPPLDHAPPDQEWLRLDPRMLMVGPVSALKQFAIPAIIALVGISSSQGGFSWWMLPILLIAVLVIGLIPWLTTGYRFTDTQFQRRSGLISKKQLTARLDRVRSVDIEATLLHRVLGLATVKVGTGVDDTQIELNSLSRDQALVLQQTLLARARENRTVSPGSGDGPATHSADPASRADPAGPAGPADPADPSQPPATATAQDVEPAPEEVLATVNWSWLRFAPLNLALLAVVAAALGFMGQFVDDIPLPSEASARETWEQISAVAIPLLVVVLLLGGVALWTVISVVGYAVRWYGMRLTRNEDTVRLTAGLLTTRSTSVEEKRIRGVRLSQPALMRVFRGAELATLATGVGSGGTTSVMPPSPLRENQRVAGLLLGGDEPMLTEVVEHGPHARRRIHLRRQWWTLFLTVAAGFLVWQFDKPWWWALGVALVAAVANVVLAQMTYGLLGHALTTHHLVSREGTLTSSRTVLESDGIIGWVITQNLFQRRVGLVTLVATTAAGGERVVVHDVPQSTAVGVASSATPSAVTPFLADQVS